MFSDKLGRGGKLYGLWLKAENGGPMLFAKATMTEPSGLEVEGKQLAGRDLKGYSQDDSYVDEGVELQLGKKKALEYCPKFEEDFTLGRKWAVTFSGSGLKDGRGVRPIRSLKGSSFLISESPSLAQDTLMSSKDIQRQSFAEIHAGLMTTPEEIGSLEDSMERLIIKDEVEGRKE
ncbi:hypothetical protein FNV43_RR10295 [Rhamnella rubrinervis]|uniref:Uncharacterized protein n=1 Tax=Rhamnella rubrinervis TaxID=2594499 RepID=A0A8K0HBI9_9ROSA|nr:hypothetical protein FNV43_RR10295 [Rhamnella rubrinervis]